MNPDEYTLRELICMVDARGRFEWNQTSTLIAVVINLMRDPKKKAVTPKMFNPFLNKKQEKEPVAQVPVSVLKDVFVRNKQ